MTTVVTIDLAGGSMGGAARYRKELNGYLGRRGLQNVKVIGGSRSLSPAWLAAREAAAPRRSRRIALNNVGFLTPGGERWTLLANALHFPAVAELTELEPWLRTAMARQAAMVHRAARHSDVLIAPCTAMAERIAAVLPDVTDRLVVRMHPVSPAASGPAATGQLVFCPVLFAPYKHMEDRIAEWLTAVDAALDDGVRLIVTASPGDVPSWLAASPRLHFVGRLDVARAQQLMARCRALYYPTTLESFGCPLAEARVTGQPVIAVDSPQNQEIAGRALFGFDPGDRESLLHATRAALAATVTPDPAPFDPDAYFDWMLGSGEPGKSR